MKICVDAYSGPDLPNPHILRSLANVKAVSVHTSHSGCHAIVLDITGHAFLFGRSTPPALGIPPTLFVSEDTPIRLSPSELGAPLGTKFVHAACGRAHSLLVGSNGDVWSAGLNTLGQVRQPFLGF
jgi:alpha-tubulin suppressor-like RCC1 family protein